MTKLSSISLKQSCRWLWWPVLVIAALGTGVGLWSPSRVVPVSVAEVARQLPELSPQLWQADLPGISLQWGPLYGRHREKAMALGLDPGLIEGKGSPEAVEREQLRAVLAELPEIWGQWPTPEFGTGAASLVLRLAPPGAAPRAIVALRGRGSLFVVEEGRATLLTAAAERVAVVDLDGDGRPEVVASGIYGSGHFLQVQVFAWDDRRVRQVFRYVGSGESGPIGFLERPDGARDLWVEETPRDTADARGLFTDPRAWMHGPFLRDRVQFRWSDGGYKPVVRYRLATPFYNLNRYLYFAGRRDWAAAAAYAEPGAQVDRALARVLGHGPFRGGRDDAFVNGRMYFEKGEESYYADFGPAGRLLRLGRGRPGFRPIPSVLKFAGSREARGCPDDLGVFARRTHVMNEQKLPKQPPGVRPGGRLKGTRLDACAVKPLSHRVGHLCGGHVQAQFGNFCLFAIPDGHAIPPKPGRLRS